MTQVKTLLIFISLKYFIISATERPCSIPKVVGGYNAFPIPKPSIAHGIPSDYTIWFRCYDGKTLVGPSKATCQDGSWSALPGHCE